MNWVDVCSVAGWSLTKRRGQIDRTREIRTAHKTVAEISRSQIGISETATLQVDAVAVDPPQVAITGSLSGKIAMPQIRHRLRRIATPPGNPSAAEAPPIIGPGNGAASNPRDRLTVGHRFRLSESIIKCVHCEQSASANPVAHRDHESATRENASQPGAAGYPGIDFAAAPHSPGLIRHRGTGTPRTTLPIPIMIIAAEPVNLFTDGRKDTARCGNGTVHHEVAPPGRPDPPLAGGLVIMKPRARVKCGKTLSGALIDIKGNANVAAPL